MIPKHKIKKNPRDNVAPKSRNIIYQGKKMRKNEPVQADKSV